MPFNKERLLKHYFKMLSIDSTPGKEGNMAKYLRSELEAMGLNVTTSWYKGEPKWPSLVTRICGSNPSNAPSLLMIGHMDTVKVAEGWETDPFTPCCKGDKVYALGACDMKGGVAAILETVHSLVEDKIPLRGDLLIAFVSDEEGLSRGCYQLIQDNLLKADMALMAECRFKSAAVGFRGRFSFLVTVKGKAAHAAEYNAATYDNAIIKAAQLASAIEKLGTAEHPKVGKGTWLVRHIVGGTKETLSVPESCELFVDRYVVPGETVDSCIKQIKDAVKELGLEEKVEITLSPRDTPFMEGCCIPEDHKLVKVVSKFYKQETGETLGLAYDKSVCDSNYLMTLANIPTLTFGPSGAGWHGPNEYGLVSEVVSATKIYINTVKEILG